MSKITGSFINLHTKNIFVITKQEKKIIKNQENPKKR